MVENKLCLQNARLIWRNFSGNEGTFNPAGRRNFCVILNEDQALALKADGWNVKESKAIEEDEPSMWYMQVGVNFGAYPPKIVLITSNGKTTLNEDTINILDWAEIKNVDLVIRPYNWEVRGSRGVKGYVKSMYITIEEDELEQKYADVPDSAQSTMAMQK